MSQEATSASGNCRVCGQELSGTAPATPVCECAACASPVHVECFIYTGGCPIFSCGSRAARFSAKPPEGWREQPDGSWAIPAGGAVVPRKGFPIDRALNQVFKHWRTTAQLELFSVLGQTWFAAGALALALIGKWKLPPLLLASLAAVVLAHANTLVGLARMGLILTSVDESEPMDAARRAAAARAGTIGRSRVLHAIGTVLLLAGLVVNVDTIPTWAWMAVTFSALVPWFSLYPRWAMERMMLEAARGVRSPALPPPAAARD